MIFCSVKVPPEMCKFLGLNIAWVEDDSDIEAVFDMNQSYWKER